VGGVPDTDRTDPRSRKVEIMECEHVAVELSEEMVPLSHMVSVVHWFTCVVCGERAGVVTKTEMFAPGAPGS
jgi:hypothetical protein